MEAPVLIIHSVSSYSLGVFQSIASLPKSTAVDFLQPVREKRSAECCSTESESQSESQSVEEELIEVDASYVSCVFSLGVKAQSYNMHANTCACRAHTHDRIVIHSASLQPYAFSFKSLVLMLKFEVFAVINNQYALILLYILYIIILS